jgi:DNA-binding MarR family transcriptional regulator
MIGSQGGLTTNKGTNQSTQIAFPPKPNRGQSNFSSRLLTKRQTLVCCQILQGGLMSEKATERENQLCYALIRSGQFNCVELSILQYINSYSQVCTDSLEQIARGIGKSIATVKRGLKLLIAKGIVRRTYGVFKKLILRLIPLDEQKKLLGGGMIRSVFKNIKKAARKARKKLMISTDSSSMSRLNSSSVSYSIREKQQEKNFLDPIKNLGEKVSLKPAFLDLAKHRDEQLARFKAAYCQN